jgi:hypothetical protein
MRILGFWHIYAINSWYLIVLSQLRILLTSGLYDACEEINISFIGNARTKEHLEKFVISQYPKLKIKNYSIIAFEYEFPALRLIENDKSEYVGFYFHTKGVTRPFEENIINWNNWLCESILNRWQEHYERVCNGWDASSVNRMYSPDHFSGNFWWFNRGYINRLPKIDTLDHQYRFAAEQWICMAEGRLYAEEFVEPGIDVFTMKYKKL